MWGDRESREGMIGRCVRCYKKGNAGKVADVLVIEREIYGKSW